MNDWLIAIPLYIGLIIALSRMYHLSWKQTLLIGLLPVGWPVALVWFGIRAITVRRHRPGAAAGGEPGPTSSGV